MSRGRGLRVAVASGLSFLMLATHGACTNQNATLGVSVIPPPQETVRLSTNVMPILSKGGCATSFCHGGPTVSANLNLEKIFDSTVGAVGVSSCEAPTLKRIAPFDSSNSYLIHKLEGNLSGLPCAPCDTVTAGPVSNCGSMMPPVNPQAINASDIEIIRHWIDQGAKDN